MFNIKRHVGRPSNAELIRQRNVKLFLFILPIVIVIMIIVLLSTDSLSNLMGNSVTEYYCNDNSYTLKGDKCIREIKEKSAMLGDVNLDEKITEEDLKLVSGYADLVNEGEEQKSDLTNLQIKVADINQDGEVFYNDETILREYLNGTVSTYGVYQENIGVKRYCEDGYVLSDKYCLKQEIIKATVKETQSKNDQGNGNSKINSTNKNENKQSNTTDFTIEFNGNGGVNSMQNQNITYGIDTPISKNQFIKLYDERNFLYWNVYNKTKDRWLCYSEQNKETYLTKNECEKINAGYVHLSDGQKISTIAQPGETIVLYAQWGTDFYINFRGENNSSKNQKVTYGQKAKLDKNSFAKNGYKFIGWHVGGWVLSNNKEYGYLCYSDNNKSKTEFMSDENCNKYGYVLLKDEAEVTIGKEIINGTYLFAQWEKEKEKVNNDIGISVTDNLDTVTNFYDSSIKSNVVANSNFKKITIKADFQLNNSSKKYYYKWKTYRYDSLNYQSDCLVIKSGITEKTLDLTLGIRKGQYIIYSDSKCNNEIKQIETDSYKNHYYDGYKVSVDKITTVKSSTKNIFNNKVSINNNPSANNVYYPYNTDLTFKIDFDVYDHSTNYYYKWAVYGSSGYMVGSQCKKIPDSGYAFETISLGQGTQNPSDFKNLYGEVTVYESPQCGIVQRGFDKGDLMVPSKATKTLKTTPKYKFQTFKVKYDANGGKGANSTREYIYNYKNNVYADYVRRDGYDFIGYKVKNSKGQYVCYKNTSKTSQGFTNNNDCKKYGYVIYKKTDTLARTTSVNNETLTFIAQWTNKPVNVKISKLGQTKLSKGTRVTNTVSFDINDKENTYYYKWGYLKINTDNYSDKAFIAHFDQYSTISKYSDYDGSPIGLSGYDWNLPNQKCRKITSSTYFQPHITVERNYNVGIILVYKDSSCNKLIASEKNVHKLTEIYRCKNCKKY